jgi:hypothetical protein
LAFPSKARYWCSGRKQGVQESQTANWAFLGGGVGLVLAVLVFVFWVWMLVDCITKETDNTQKIIWALVIFFLPCVGSLVYLFARKLRRGSA